MPLDASTPAIPFFGPPIIAVFASSIRGITGFGDGITFSALWSIASVFNLVPSMGDARVLRRAVFFSTCMQTVSMPIQLWQARAQLRLIIFYAIVMSMSGAMGVVLGAHALLEGEATALREGAGSFFYIFSVGSLLSRAIIALRKHHSLEIEPQLATANAGATAPALSTPAKTATAIGTTDFVIEADEDEDEDDDDEDDESAVVEEETERVGLLSPLPKKSGGAGAGGGIVSSSPETIVRDVSPSTRAAVASTETTAAVAWVPPAVLEAARAASAGGASVNLAPSASSEVRGGARRCAALIDFVRAPLPASYFPRLSPVFEPKSMLILLLCAGMCGGFLGGLLGTGGPPMMLAYAQLQLDKDVLRGFAIEPSILMLVRLTMYVASPVSVVDFGADGGLGDAPIAATIAASSLVGMVMGSSVRHYLPVDGLIAAILLLVFVASALMLHADSDVFTATFYISTVFFSNCAFTLLWNYKRLWDALPGRH